MPLQRRLPKFGFRSRKSLFREDLRVAALVELNISTVTLESLQMAGLVRKNVKHVKLFGEGQLNRAFKVSGIQVTKGARATIESSGGTVEG